MTATELAAELAKQSEKVCEYLLPAGRLNHGNWVVGGVSGDAGKSLHVQLGGPKAGVWLDFATGEKGDLIGLWQAVRGVNLRDACAEAERFLGLEPEPSTKSPPSKAWAQLQKEMGSGTEHDLHTLASMRKLGSTDGLRLAVSAGHLFFGPVFDGEGYRESWIITDSSRLAAQARPMDGGKYADGQKSKTIHGTSGRWPIGVAGAAVNEFALVEGGPDFLAAYTAVAALGASIQPVAMLGSSQSIHPEALALFKNSTVWLFPHNDENLAGLQGAIKWTRALRGIGATVIPFDFSPYPGVKDLNDFVAGLNVMANGEWEEG